MNEQPFPRIGRPRLKDAADIHTHILPAIDDGAISKTDSLKMALLAARYGTTLIVATPHRFWNNRELRPELIRELTAKTQREIEQRKFGKRIRIVPGQEIPLAQETADDLAQGEVLTLGDTGVYALVEPPFDHLPEWTASALADIVAAGFRPVLAHPERNMILQREPERVVPFVEAGALLQLTAMSVVGENGVKAFAATRWMLDRNLVACIASDSHRPIHRPPTVRAAFHFAKAHYGLDFAQRLCIRNPRAIATGYVLP